MRISDWSSDVCSSDLRKGDKQLDIGRCMPAEATCREIGGADEGVPTIRIVFCMQVWMHQKASAARPGNVVEDFEITDAGGDDFGKPTRDASAFRPRFGNGVEQPAQGRGFDEIGRASGWERVGQSL